MNVLNLNGINPILIHELPPALAGGKLIVNDFLHEWIFF